MKSGKHVPEAGAHDGGVNEPSAGREASRQVRDIQELIAKLEVVTKRLAYPLRGLPQPRRRCQGAKVQVGQLLVSFKILRKHLVSPRSSAPKEGLDIWKAHLRIKLPTA